LELGLHNNNFWMYPVLGIIGNIDKTLFIKKTLGIMNIKEDKFFNKERIGIIIILLVGLLLGFCLSYAIFEPLLEQYYIDGYEQGVVDCATNRTDMVIEEKNIGSGVKDTIVWVKDTNTILKHKN
jgi:hypothetical protein